MERRIFRAPDLTAADHALIDAIALAREALRQVTADNEPRRWIGSLRRLTLAQNVQASNSIEGYASTIDDALLAVDGEQPLEVSAATRAALTGYRDAMTYVLQIAGDPGLRVDAGLLKALHFMMLKDDLTRSPGSWRRGPIFVRHGPTAEIVYQGPDADLVPDLIDSLVASLAEDGNALIQAAMAHLNLVMIHPFRDGNGRMARCLQTLVLGRDGFANPVFSSIEEYLSRNTPAYYEVLGAVGKGSWSPENDARPWVRFCLEAHLQQARTTYRRVVEIHRLWNACAELADRHSLNERVIGGLVDAARGIRLRRPGYIRLVGLTTGEEISALTASRDLRDLVVAGLLVPTGATRARFYATSASLAAEWEAIRSDGTWPGPAPSAERR